MRLLVIGASGRTGRHLVELALARGNHVTALIRTTSDSPNRSGLALGYGDPRDPDVLAPLLKGQDAAISCLGQKSSADEHLLRDSAAAFIDASRLEKAPRYLVVSQGLQYPTKNPTLLMLRWILAKYVADTAAMEILLQRSTINWTIVRPPRLLEGGQPRGYRTAIGGMPPGRQ
jgi:uncharacterized protein YbjT (DUF2867 family)